MSQRKVALITGITGQDGTYLAEFLLERGYDVHGLVRWDAHDSTQRLNELDVSFRNLKLHFGDMTDAQNLTALIKKIAPSEIYNLAALSHVQVSFTTPASTFDTNAKGTLHILEAIKLLGMADTVRLYQASSSEMFGSSPVPQNEETPMHPCSPYGVAKLAAYWLVRTYRDAYGIHASNGILFNHESPIRGEDFVTRKITQAVVAIENGRQQRLRLGNLNSMRDWGHAADYVEGMWLMLQQGRPDDYVLATGESHSVREFTARAFAQTGVQLVWEGEDLREVGKDRKSGRVLVDIDESLFRPKEVPSLLGDASKARKKLGWAPKGTFERLVSDMVNAERNNIWGSTSWAQKAG